MVLFATERKFPQMRRKQPLVGVVLDATLGYGRAVLRGIMQYANGRTEWLYQEEFHAGAKPIRHWGKCDGTITTWASPDAARQILRRCKYVVSCSGNEAPANMPIVCGDDEAIGKMAAEHLMDNRLEHFGFYGISVNRVAQSRFKGFCDALSKRGFTCSQSKVVWHNPQDLTLRHHWPAVIRWLKDLPKPVGVMAFDDASARSLAMACMKAGIAVPDQVAIIGVNNDDLLCNMTWPPLSSVEVDFQRVGYTAARILDQMLSGKKLAAADRITRLAPIGVVKRASTDVLAVDDAQLANAVRYIREHACDPCSVSDVLEHVPVGRRWLERQFLRQLRRTPHDEILGVQMDTARRLLLHSDLTVVEVGLKCGFSTAQSFSRAFRQKMNASPAAYRRTNRHTTQ
jgi:LacI family transcriptional regulator